MLWKRIPLALAVAAGLCALPAFAQDEPKPEEPAKVEAADTAKADDKPAEEKPAEEKPAEEKKADDKPKEDKPKDEKPADEKSKEEPPKKEETRVEVVTLVTNLENPSGLAVHGKTGHVFIASRYGIYRYDPKAHVPPTIEVAGYPTDIYGKGPKYDIGPLGVDFLGEKWLIVGDGSRPDGQEVVRVYEIAETPAKEPLAEDKAAITLGPLPEGSDTATEGEKTTKAEGNFYDVAVGKTAIFVSSNGDDTKGWIHRVGIQDGKPNGKLTPTIATKEDVQTDAPVPLEFNPDKTELFVGQMGEINVPGDGLLLVYDPESNELKRQYPLGLSDPAGLAFSPKTGKLYVTDFAWAEPDKGGLFEVSFDGDKLSTKKVEMYELPTTGDKAGKKQDVKLDKPTAIAFDADGKLFLVQVGTADESAKSKSGEPLAPGKLMVIDAGL